MGASKSWMDNLYAIARHRSVTYKDLSRLSKCLGFNWEFVLLKLGQSHASFDQSKVDNLYQTAFQIYDSLLKWKKEHGERSNTVKAIEETLLETCEKYCRQSIIIFDGCEDCKENLSAGSLFGIRRLVE